MSLELISSRTFNKENYDNYIFDIDKEFAATLIVGTQQVRSIMKDIDGADFVDSREFIDRFGKHLYIDRLSTGCKAAILVALKPDMVIDTRECGLNARDTIVCNCKEGHIVFYDMGTTIKTCGRENTSIDVVYRGKEYDSIDDLNEVI